MRRSSICTHRYESIHQAQFLSFNIIDHFSLILTFFSSLQLFIRFIPLCVCCSCCSCSLACAMRHLRSLSLSSKENSNKNPCLFCLITVMLFSRSCSLGSLFSLIVVVVVVVISCTHQTCLHTHTFTNIRRYRRGKLKSKHRKRER